MQQLCVIAVFVAVCSVRLSPRARVPSCLPEHADSRQNSANILYFASRQKLSQILEFNFAASPAAGRVALLQPGVLQAAGGRHPPGRVPAQQPRDEVLIMSSQSALQFAEVGSE